MCAHMHRHIKGTERVKMQPRKTLITPKSAAVRPASGPRLLSQTLGPDAGLSCGRDLASPSPCFLLCEIRVNLPLLPRGPRMHQKDPALAHSWH